MTDPTRRSLAYIATTLINNKIYNGIHDYSTNQHFNFSFALSAKQITVFDYDQSCYITGSGNNNSFSLFHYGNSSHITLDIKGSNFNGYDYGTGKHFSGSVNDKSVSMYDYGPSQYFNYILQ